MSNATHYAFTCYPLVHNVTINYAFMISVSLQAS